jgi:hypothetical protein
MDDAFTDRLSEYLDGELGPDERRELEQHLEQCESCERTLSELRAVRTTAGHLVDKEPPRDLWPSVLGALTPRWRRAIVPVAALALLALGALAWWSWPRDTSSDGRRQFMLILHRETEQAMTMTSDQRKQVVAEYRAWASAMRRVDRLVEGNKLGTEGWVLRPQYSGTSAARQETTTDEELVTGYFVIRASDEAEALTIAKGCPHLRFGGWIELRPIEDV